MFELDILVRKPNGAVALDGKGRPLRMQMRTRNPAKVEAYWLSNGFRIKPLRPKRGKVRVVS